MIDLDVIRQQVELASQKRRNNFTLSIDEAADLITRLRQAEKDAARYRWLRDECFGDWEVGGVEVSYIEVTLWKNDGFDNCNFGESLHGAEMDSAIDEAMSGINGGDL